VTRTRKKNRNRRMPKSAGWSQVQADPGPHIRIAHAILAYSRSDLTVFYDIEVRTGDAVWRTSKRYSEIERLHRALLGQKRSTVKKMTSGVSRVFSSLPSLPSKSLFQKTNSSISLIEKRRRGLESYLQQVVAHTTGTPEQIVLDTFLSSTSTDGVDLVMSGALTPSSQEIPDEGAVQVGEADHCGWVLPTVVSTTWTLQRRGQQHPLHRVPQLPVLVVLPWAREWDSGCGCRHATIQSVRSETRQTVHRRFLEFRAVLDWMAMEGGDKVFSAQDVMQYISRRRALTWDHYSPRIRRIGVSREPVLRCRNRTYYCGPRFADMTIHVTPPVAPSSALRHQADGLHVPSPHEATPPEEKRTPGTKVALYPHQVEAGPQIDVVTQVTFVAASQGHLLPGDEGADSDESDGSSRSSTLPTLPPTPDPLYAHASCSDDCRGAGTPAAAMEASTRAQLSQLHLRKTGPQHT